MRILLILGLGIACAGAAEEANPGGVAERAANVQGLEGLPAQPLPTDPGNVVLMPDELPLPFTQPEAEPPSAEYRLKLATDAMSPVLPPLDLAKANEGLVRIVVKRFEFSGNTVFSKSQLARVVAKFTGREITSEELEEARMELTRLYVDAGYINSGAVLPDQDVAGGIIKFDIVEGKLTDIDLSGEFWFRSWWLKHQLRRAAGTPVNFNQLKTGLQLLRQNPGISRVNAELKPGIKPGESILHVMVKDEQPFRAGFEISNKRPPSVGEGLGELYFSDLNLTGHNDPLDLRWGLVRWTKDGDIDYDQFDNIQGSYEVPVSPWDTTLGFHASKSDTNIVDETFAELGITSKSIEYGATLRQPVYLTLTNSVAVSLSADHKESETYLLGRPFTLSPGALDGQTEVFALRASLEWVNRTQSYVLALRTTFSVGLYAFGSTRAPDFDGSSGLSSDIPDSKFFSWVGQAQYVKRIFDTVEMRKRPDTQAWNALRESLLVLRLNAQLSDEPLLSLEQFSIGGAQSVRGYRENQLLRDNGIFASAELRLPVWLNKEKTPLVSLVPFFDLGTGWDSRRLQDSQTVYSAGIGVLLNMTKHVQASLYWGHPFVELQKTKDSLQDYGLHFAISFNAF